MKKIIAAVASVTAIAALAVPALASANVSSAQKTTPLTLTTTYNGRSLSSSVRRFVFEISERR